MILGHHFVYTSHFAIHHSFYVSSHSTHQRPSSDDIHAGYYMNARLMAQHLNHNIVSLILAIHVHYKPIDALLYTLLFSWA